MLCSTSTEFDRLSCQVSTKPPLCGRKIACVTTEVVIDNFVVTKVVLTGGSTRGGHELTVSKAAVSVKHEGVMNLPELCLI